MELEQRFGDDGACRQYLFGLRWPQGFECSACGGRGVWNGSRNRLLCASCRRQIYILAGTVFQDSHLPLALWFRAMWHLTTRKMGSVLWGCSGNLESEAIRRHGRRCTSCVEPWFVPVVSVCGVPSKLMRPIGEHRKKAQLAG